MEVVCRKKAKASKNKEPAVQEGALFDALCSVETIFNDGVLSLDHHTYSDFQGKWIQTTSKPQPFITVKMSLKKTDYKNLGLDMTIRNKETTQHVLADTGCQSCLAGLKVVEKLGISKDKLIPVTLKMKAANNNGIKILGAVILRFSGLSDSGQQLETRQIVYVTNDSDKLFLSRETCAALGVISKSFQKIGESDKLDDSTAPSITEFSKSTSQEQAHMTAQIQLKSECGCPKRQMPPVKPTVLPYPATEENRERIQQWLLDYYSSSTFNTCEHQPLPMMEGPPMRLMVNADANPVAWHTPIPVPLHWQETVKAGLDRDVQLGVIEPVPVGEPVTWCHRMVVCAKKDGEPRRTVDLQSLNAHATRETHHTQSPFHQAHSVPQGTKKTVFDCWNGYHSVPLHKEDRHLTTFITPWGRYRYKTAPQGYIASGDGYSRRFDEIVSHVPDKTICINDTLLRAKALSDSFFQSIQ